MLNWKETPPSDWEVQSVVHFLTISPLHTVCRCSQTMAKLLFCEKKLSFMKHDEETHTIHHRLQFLRMCVATEKMVKKVLWVRQKTAYSGECILWKSFLRNAHKPWRIILCTLFMFRNSFVVLSIFCGCLWIVCIGLY